MFPAVTAVYCRCIWPSFQFAVLNTGINLATTAWSSTWANQFSISPLMDYAACNDHHSAIATLLPAPQLANLKLIWICLYHTIITAMTEVKAYPKFCENINNENTMLSSLRWLGFVFVLVWLLYWLSDDQGCIWMNLNFRHSTLASGKWTEMSLYRNLWVKTRQKNTIKVVRGL